MKRAEKENGFYTRGFTTFLIAMAFGIALVSGLVLYGTPRGRVANWTGWVFLGIDKEQWGAVHINSTLLFAGAAALHLFYNWKVLLNYLRNRRSVGIRRRRELLTALAVATITVVGTLYSAPPFGMVMTAHEWVKDYWEADASRPAIVHGEDLTFEEFAREAGVDLEAATIALSARHINNVHPDTRVGDLAEESGISPERIYTMIQPGGAPALSIGGAGWGRTSIASWCDQSNIDLAVALERLRSEGYTAEATTTFRQLAVQRQVTPYEIARLLGAPTRTHAVGSAIRGG